MTKNAFPELRFFPETGRCLVLNVSTTALFEIDGVAAKLLMHPGAGSRQLESDGERAVLGEIEDSGLLSVLPPPTREPDTPLTILYLNVSASCNLCCSYCFASQGAYTGKSEPMSVEVGERAIDLLLCESRDRAVVRVVFFGGEPLLNSEVIAHVIAYGRRQAAPLAKRIRFDVVTNGTLLTSEMIQLFAAEKVAVVVSLDGPPEVHNHLRSTADGKDTYDLVLGNIRRLQRAGVRRVGIHATIPSLSPSPVSILDHVSNLNVGPFQLGYVDPIRANLQPWAGTGLSALKASQQEMVDYFLDRLYHERLVPCRNFLEPLFRLYRRDRFPSHCTAGISMAAVDAEGAVFPCSRFAEDPSLAIGSVTIGLDRAKQSPYRQHTIDGQEPCRACWARYLCGGGCLYDNLLATGAITRPDPWQCALSKHWLALMVRLYGRIQRDMPDLVERAQREGLDWLLSCDEE